VKSLQKCFYKKVLVQHFIKIYHRKSFLHPWDSVKIKHSWDSFLVFWLILRTVLALHTQKCVGKMDQDCKKFKMVFRCWESNYFVDQITNLKGWAVYYIILVNYIKAL